MLWQMVSSCVKHNCVYRSTKRNNKIIVIKTSLLKILILLFLKCGGEWISKIQNLTITAITVMKSNQKLTKWKIWLPFPEDKDKFSADDKKAGQSQ